MGEELTFHLYCDALDEGVRFATDKKLPSMPFGRDLFFSFLCLKVNGNIAGSMG